MLIGCEEAHSARAAYSISFASSMLVVMDAAHFKYALGHGSGLIKYHIFCLGKCLQIVGTLYQNAFLAGAADSCKKAERDTDDQCTWDS